MPRKYVPTGRPPGRPKKQVAEPERVDIMALRREAEVQYRQQVVELYLSGVSTTDIGRQFGVTRQAIAQMLKREGVELRPRGGNMGAHSRHRK